MVGYRHKNQPQRLVFLWDLWNTGLRSLPEGICRTRSCDTEGASGSDLRAASGWACGGDGPGV